MYKNKATRNKYARETRLFYKNLGFCVTCHRERIYGNESNCPECRAKKAASAAKLREKRKLEANYAEIEKLKRIKVQEKRKAEGKCPYCGRSLKYYYSSRECRTTFKMCRVCLERHRISQANRRERMRADGQGQQG